MKDMKNKFTNPQVNYFDFNNPKTNLILELF